MIADLSIFRPSFRELVWAIFSLQPSMFFSLLWSDELNVGPFRTSRLFESRRSTAGFADSFNCGKGIQRLPGCFPVWKCFKKIGTETGWLQHHESMNTGHYFKLALKLLPERFLRCRFEETLYFRNSICNWLIGWYYRWSDWSHSKSDWILRNIILM